MGSLNDHAIDIARLVEPALTYVRGLYHPPLLQYPRSGDRSNHQFPASRIRCPSGITANIVTRIENGAHAKQSTIDRLRRALETAGIEFTTAISPAYASPGSPQRALRSPRLQACSGAGASS